MTSRISVKALLCAALFIYISAFGLRADADEFVVPIQLQTANGAAYTDHSAIVRTYEDARLTPDIWLSRAVVDAVGGVTRYDAGRKSFVAGDIALPTRDIDGEMYVNVSDIEQTSGIAYKLSLSRRDPQANSILVGSLSAISKTRSPALPTHLPPLSHPFVLVWDHITSSSPPDISASPIDSAISVISPTWFALTDANGSLSSRANISYVRAAHASGARVWPTVTNSFNKERTTDFLADQGACRRFADQMIVFATIYGFDGINIDFESIDNGDADRFTSFVAMLAEACRASGLSVSVDTSVPSSWSKSYDRASLSRIVDYVVIMAYDEHSRTSQRAGSTASLPWTEEKLKSSLVDVPSDKLLLGMPLYTREWTERYEGGDLKVSAKAMSMDGAEAAVARAGAEKIWLSDIGQHYAEWMVDGVVHKIWLEDEASLARRLSFVRGYGIAGAAFWRRGFERPSIWGQVADALR